MLEPLMQPDIFHSEPSLGVGVYNFLDQVLAAGWDESWDQVLAVQYLFV